MRFVDLIELEITAGKGGDGAVAFRRELYVPKGGPAGGDGGKGGDVIFEASNNLNTLVELSFQKIIKADDGANGQHKNMHGHKAKDKYIQVPVGTIIFNKETNEIICDLKNNKEQFIVAKGGKGGKGNARFVNSKNKAPTIFECGDLGEHLFIRCELKLLADVGFVGLPNAGKSTLLSVLTKAKPQIAGYSFTTISPQLGVCIDKNKRSFTIADLPGLIKGASLGKGLGHIFLKHIERCRVIVHVIDASSNYTYDSNLFIKYQTIINELREYNPSLLKRKQIIVLNKIDAETSIKNIEEFKKNNISEKMIEVSGLNRLNLENLKIEIGNLLDLAKSEENNEFVEKKDHFIYEYKNIMSSDFIVSNLGNGKWNVSGKAVFKIYHKYPPKTYDNLLVFNDQLKTIGVFDELRKQKAKDGDLIIIYDLEMEWKD